MNQKPVNFSKKYRRSRMTEGCKATRRATLFSLEDSEQLAAESSRARLIQQLTQPTDEALPRDFTSYFQSSNKNGEPTCLATSHHIKGLVTRNSVVIPTYPCMQSLRWNPYVESSSFEDEPNIADKRSDLRSEMRCDQRSKPDPRCPRFEIRPQLTQNLRPDPRPEPRPEPQNWPQPEEPKFNCKCESCTTKKCPSRAPPPTTRPVFKDNIMTFCDRQTMTPKLNEVGCGCATISATRVSEMSVTASDIAVRDTQTSMQIHKCFHNSPEQCPASILKKNNPNEEFLPSYSKSHCCEHAYRSSNQQEPERDMGEEYIPPSKISSMKSFFKSKKRIDCLNPRRNIYNEGISDLVADNFPVAPVRVPSPRSLKSDRSKTSVRSRCCLNEGIPFSHRADSHYHHDCKKSKSRSFYGDNDDVRHLVTSPEVVRKTYASRPIKFNRIPPIRMPKKVLTSERDIESFIDRGFPQVSVPVTRRPRGN